MFGKIHLNKLFEYVPHIFPEASVHILIDYLYFNLRSEKITYHSICIYFCTKLHFILQLRKNKETNSCLSFSYCTFPIFLATYLSITF